MEYVVDTYALRVRLAVDGRTMGLIAKDAKLPPETIKEVLATGKAEKDVIDKIRLAVRPNMYFSTICPEALQAKKKPDLNDRDTWAERLLKTQGDEIKRNLELQKKLEELCNEYSTIDVFDIISEWKDALISYLEISGFNLLELLDEYFDDNAPGFYLNEKGEVEYTPKGGQTK